MSNIAYVIGTIGQLVMLAVLPTVVIVQIVCLIKDIRKNGIR